jgi:hypothetical protein
MLAGKTWSGVVYQNFSRCILARTQEAHLVRTNVKKNLINTHPKEPIVGVPMIQTANQEVGRDFEQQAVIE